jgi:hypothetical protein
MVKYFNPSAETIEPSRDEVFRFLGMGKNTIPSQKSRELFSIALNTFRDQIDPKGIMKEISNPEFAKVYSGSGMNEPDALLGNIFPEADHLALMVFTLGEKISRRINDLFDSRDFALASMLDAIASQSADIASGYAEHEFRHFFPPDHSKPFLTVLFYSPGYCGWHISAQKQLFEYMKPVKIGVELNPQYLMIPLKSISGVLVAGPQKIHIFKNNFSFCGKCAHKSCLTRMKSVVQNNKESNYGTIESNLTESSNRR